LIFAAFTIFRHWRIPDRQVQRARGVGVDSPNRRAIVRGNRQARWETVGVRTSTLLDDDTLETVTRHANGKVTRETARRLATGD